MKIHERLKFFRESVGLTQKDVSEKLRIKQYNISDYETGRASPSIEIIIKLADLYQVTIDDLLNHKSTYVKQTNNSNIDVFSEYIKDLNSLKILRRIEKLTPEEKEKLYPTIDTFIKTLFNK